MPVLNSIADSAEDLAGWRQHIHQNPEIGLECVATAAFVAARLREIGVDEIHEGIGRTGIVALIKGRAEGPVLGLRADMDALPMPETTGKPYASQVEGAMHACGHDGHTTMLLGAAKYLAGTRNFAGTVALIFQPAEETGEGAKAMLAEGIMDRFQVERVFGIHTSPMHDLGLFITRPGPLMASVGDFDIVVKGRGGHGAYPQRAADPVAAALVIGNALQTIVSRNIDANDEVVLSITNIHAGSAFNVIPAEARLGGTIRSFSVEARDLVRRRMREICEGVAAGMGCTVEISATIDLDPTVNHEAETALAVEVAREVSGCEIAAHPQMGGEDFGAMLGARPGAFLFLGQGKGPMVHETDFDFNDAAAPIGASFFARLVERALPLA
ncbi:MAG: M20 family metallopeptidase [Allgaiera sp.]|jgi:amidohydrolase|nr:M20 family metallopeptidase [Allgaiera sp.]